MARESDALSYRQRYRGLIGIKSKMPIRDMSVLSRIYTPGVAAVCREIDQTPASSYKYSCRGNSIAIISDGSQTYEFGNVGAQAVLPKLEAKSVIFKTFANVDAVPLAIKTQNSDEFVEIVRNLAPTFGGFCLESIASPKCFTIENRLRKAVRVAVLLHEAHVTGIVVLAALYNALKVVGKKLEEVRIVISGAGTSGIGVAKGLLVAGTDNIVLCDRHGALRVYRMEGMNWAKSEIARLVRRHEYKDGLAEVMKGADVFIGLSAQGLVTQEMVASMAPDPIVFALALPEPEISEADARAAGAAVVATGKADSRNQIRSSLVAPGCFRGCVDVGAERVNVEMYVAAAQAMAAMIPEEELSPTNIIPRQMDFHIAPVVAQAVARAAQATGVAQIGPEEMPPEKVYERLERYIYEGELAWLPQEGQDYGKLSIEEEALEVHRRYQGVIQIYAKVPIKDDVIYRRLYAPHAVAEVIQEVLKDPMAAFDYTCKNNLVAIVTDGSAVLGLGNIGPRAALPVMEGKAVLFKTFGGVEAFPICIGTQETDMIISLVENLAPAFSGINLEDISSPRCFDIERTLCQSLDIPVFHDDQHGTAVVVLAGLLNALKLVDRRLEEVKIVFSGAGASAVAVARLLLQAGAQNIIVCDTTGVVYKGRTRGMNRIKEELAELTNPDRVKGSLADALRGAEVFIGLSGPNVLNRDLVQAMAPSPVIFALANPDPEIHPEEARAAGAAVVATGRGDFPNQVNNCLAFPGIFRGALDIRATCINDAMNMAAAYAIAALVGNQMEPDYILPGAMDFRVPPAVAEAVARAAIESGVARLHLDPESVARHTREFIYDERLSLL